MAQPNIDRWIADHMARWMLHQRRTPGYELEISHEYLICTTFIKLGGTISLHEHY